MCVYVINGPDRVYPTRVIANINRVRRGVYAHVYAYLGNFQNQNYQRALPYRTCFQSSLLAIPQSITVQVKSVFAKFCPAQSPVLGRAALDWELGPTLILVQPCFAYLPGTFRSLI